jgi:hypothetical protein
MMGLTLIKTVSRVYDSGKEVELIEPDKLADMVVLGQIHPYLDQRHHRVCQKGYERRPSGSEQLTESYWEGDTGMEVIIPFI